jgi:hypothetical protein
MVVEPLRFEPILRGDVSVNHRQFHFYAAIFPFFNMGSSIPTGIRPLEENLSCSFPSFLGWHWALTNFAIEC